MSSVEVGKVKIKVTPDTTGFRKALKKQIKTATKGVTGKVGVDPNVNKKGLKQKVRAAAKEAATNVDVGIDFNEGQFRKISDNFKKRWAAAKVQAGKTANKRLLALEKERIKQVAKLEKAHIAAINEDRKRTLDAQQRQIDVNIKLKTAEADRRFAAWKAAIKRRGDIELNVRANRKGLQTFRRMSDAADNMSQGIQLSARSWLILTAVLLLAAPAVALVGSLLVALPSALAVVGAPIAAIALGLAGIKKALKNWTALNTLKKNLSDTFEKGLAPVLQRIGKLLPKMEGGFKHVASAVIGVVDGVGSFFEGEEAMNQFNNVMERTKDLFRDIAPFFNDFLSGLMTLTSGGADNFRFLADAFNQFGEDWSNMSNRLVHTGVMESAMKGLSTVTSSLLGNFLRLVEIGAGSMESMAGPIDTFLTGFVDMFQGMQPILTSVSNMFFEVFGNLGTVLGPVFEKMAPGIQDVTEGFTELINSNIDSLGPILQELGENMSTALVEVMKELGPMLPELTKTLGDLAVTLVKELGPQLPEIAKSFAQLAVALLKIAPSFLKSLTENIIPLIPKMVVLAEKAIELAPAFLKIAAAALSFGANVASVIGTVAGFAGVLSPIGGAIMAATGGFEGSGEKIKEWAKTVGVKIGEAVAKVAGGAVEMVASIAGMASEFASAGVSAVQGLINGIHGMIGKAVDKAKELAQSVISAVKGIGGFIVNSPSIPMIGIGESVGEGLEKGIYNSIPGSQQAIKDLAQATIGKGKGEIKEGIIFSPEDVQNLQAFREEYKNLGKELRELNKEKERLGLAGDTVGQQAVNNQIEVIKQRRKEIKEQEKSIKLGKEANKDAKEGESDASKYLNKAIDAGKSFGLANFDTLQSDLGIGGSGALSQGLDQGISFLSSTISKLVSSGLGGLGSSAGGNIIVNNVDDAVAASNNKVYKQKKQFANK